jgi:hypothetical protein
VGEIYGFGPAGSEMMVLEEEGILLANFLKVPGTLPKNFLMVH